MRSKFALLALVCAVVTVVALAWSPGVADTEDAPRDITAYSIKCDQIQAKTFSLVDNYHRVTAPTRKVLAATRLLRISDIMSKTTKPSQIRVGNWWFWQDANNPIAVNLDCVIVIDVTGFYATGEDGGFFEFEFDDVARDAMFAAMKEYQLWKLTRPEEESLLDSKEFIPHE